MKLDLENPKILLLLKTFGTPYSYGAGTPASANKSNWELGVPGINKGIGYDCSGLAQVCLVKLGLLDSRALDRTAQSLYNKCTIIKPSEAQLGDLVFYGANSKKVTHVTVYLGHEVTLGANGGTSKTNADNPKAYVKLEKYNYRVDYLGIGRFHE